MPTAISYRSKRFFVVPVGYLLHNIGAFNAPPVRCVQENVPMLTNRHEMQRGQQLDSTTQFWSTKMATSGGQGFFEWGVRPRALPLSHRCCVNEVLSPKLLLNLNGFRPTHDDSGKSFLMALFLLVAIWNQGIFSYVAPLWAPFREHSKNIRFIRANWKTPDSWTVKKHFKTV